MLPPVAMIMLLRFINSAVPPMVGMVIMVTSPSGAPASMAAAFRMRTASPMQFRALGWGETISALPALTEISALKMVVLVGLVLGTRPATTPTGMATSSIFFCVSSRMMPMVFSSLM